jgi:cytochrome c-type biogenesis protein CcmH/NrfG
MSRDFINTNEPAKLALAEVALKDAAKSADPTGETHQLLGTALFLQGKYAEAKDALEVAVKASPGNDDLKKLLARTSRNVTTKLDVARCRPTPSTSRS